ncbi:MAG: hypothetical protein O3A85_12725 [Proteobacteria bacterium]|nr:hypothetical protein [Pseudomonadota bacterium]
MARLLVSDEYPHGHDLGAILEGIRMEVLKSSHRMSHDGNPQTRYLAGHVIDCNKNALDLLAQAMGLVETLFGFGGMKRPVPVSVPKSVPGPAPQAGIAKHRGQRL